MAATSPPLRQVGYEQLSISSSVTASTLASIPAGPIREAVIRASGANVRYRADGTAPTATVGELLKDGEVLEYDAVCSRVRFVSTSSSTATLDVGYYA